MSYKKGDVVVVKFPFVTKEGTAFTQKGRPASSPLTQARNNEGISSTSLVVDNVPPSPTRRGGSYETRHHFEKTGSASE